ncbi:MAG: hypothetical protein LBG07_09360, partial [Treponema sp.]|nr:hypothetical protein [Treponema sp.]
ENPDDSEISLVDLSDDDLNMGLPVETGPAALDTAGEDTEGGETGEFSLGDGEIILEEEPVEGAEDSNSDNEPDISLDLSFSGEDSGEEISLGDFEEEALDLSNAVIDEPDLGVDLKENPVQEPVFDDFASLDGSLDKNDGELSLESSGEAPAEALEEQDFPPLGEPGEIEEISGEAEISGGEGEDISPAGGNISRGEDLDQIIPDGFVVEELDDEGADFGGLEEGLDEIPEAVELPGEEAGAVRAGIEAPDEPELSTLPGNFKSELKQVLSYMDQLLESLPEEKIEEFAKSEYFDTYKKLFKELGLA